MKGNFSKGSAASTGPYSGFFKHSGPSGCFRVKGRLTCSCWGRLSHLEIFCYFFLKNLFVIHPDREEQTGEIIPPKSSVTHCLVWGNLIRARVRGDAWIIHRQLHHQNTHKSVGERCVWGEVTCTAPKQGPLPEQLSTACIAWDM